MKITKKQALTLLGEAVTKKGEGYVDPNVGNDLDGCTYMAGKRPGCIVGHALHRAGVKPKVLRELDDLASSTIGSVTGAALGVLKSRGVEITPAAREVFSTAQSKQDMGGTWGEALRAAREA